MFFSSSLPTIVNRNISACNLKEELDNVKPEVTSAYQEIYIIDIESYNCFVMKISPLIPHYRFHLKEEEGRKQTFLGITDTERALLRRVELPRITVRCQRLVPQKNIDTAFDIQITKFILKT